MIEILIHYFIFSNHDGQSPLYCNISNFLYIHYSFFYSIFTGVNQLNYNQIFLFEQEMYEDRPPRKVLFRIALKGLNLAVFADESLHGRNNVLKHMAMVDNDRWLIFNGPYFGYFLLFMQFMMLDCFVDTFRCIEDTRHEKMYWWSGCHRKNILFSSIWKNTFKYG